MRFLLLSEKSKSGKFQKTEDRNNATLILFAYMQAVYSPQWLYTLSSYMLQRGVFVSLFISVTVFQSLIFDEHDKSLRFSCIRKPNILLTLILGDL